MKYLLIVSVLIIHYNVYSQNNEWLVKPGQNIKDVLSDSVIYKYPQFKASTVYFKDGTATNGNLNLNLFNGEMQFIKYSGDTMALSDEGLIRYITIQNDTFYYNKVYVQSIYSNAVVKLGKIEVITQVDIKKKSGYDQLTSTSSISNINYYYGSNSQVSKLEGINAILLNKKTYYFIGDRFNNFRPAIKKNISSMFNANHTAIEKFMNDNKINLSGKEDLVKLADFIQQIQQ